MTEVKFENPMWQHSEYVPLKSPHKEFIKVSNSYVRTDAITYIHMDAKNLLFIIGLNTKHESVSFKASNEDDFLKTKQSIEQQFENMHA